ncbi:MAG: Hsp33 family molecular chaperone [Pseudomonadota bacterium]
MSETPIRPVRDVADNTVLPFQVESLDVRGRVVRLGDVLDQILERHHYPRPVAVLLAQLVTLTCLLATTLKMQGRFIAQTTSDGPINMLVADYESPDRIRACARYDEEKLQALMKASAPSFSSLLGEGHFAMTIDPGKAQNRYQGIVVLQGESFEDIADKYFMQSEQIPTMVRLAVGETMTPSDNGYKSAWRSGGFLIQFLPHSPERQRMRDFPPGDIPPDWESADEDDEEDEDDAWVSARALSGTLEDAELIDPELSPEQLLYRLFHEEGVKVFDPQPIKEFCRCSEDGIARMLRQFSPDDRAHMVKDDQIHVICEFCSRQYDFTIQDISDA